MGYHIGSFNIRDFNFSNLTSDGENIQRDFEKIAEIITTEQFDIVAVQEVNAEIAIRHLTEVLNRHKNYMREYAYNFGRDMPTRSKDPERYGFIWNIKRFRLVDVPRKNNPCYYQNAGGITLQRPPYYARFTARGELGGSNFELRLVNVHIKDSKSEQERIDEFNILVKRVLPRICDHQELSVEGEMMPAYTILLGDYNIVLNKGPRAIIRIDSITETNYTGKKRYYKTVQEELTSLRLPNNQSVIDDCYANNYDHFTYEMNLITKLKLNPERIEALGKYFKDKSEVSEKLSAYRKKISDHVPVKMNLDLK